jgi:hypothetical protein
MFCKWRIAIRLAFAFIALFAQSAQAFFDPPSITPVYPAAGEVVSVNIHGGVCDSIFQVQGYPRLTREGNTLRLLEAGDHYEEGDELCVFPTGTLIRELGAFTAGDYVLTVDLIYPHPVFGPTILKFGVVSFTVAAPADPVSVPSDGTVGMTILLVALLALSGWALKKRPSILGALLLTCHGSSNGLQVAHHDSIGVRLHCPVRAERAGFL